MVQEQGAAGGGAAGGGGGGGKKRNRNRNKNRNKGNSGGAKSSSQSHDDTPPPQETRQRGGRDTAEAQEVPREVQREVPKEVAPPVETQKAKQQQLQQQNGGLVREEADLARNMARDYMPPANWLELREAEKAFYERMAKGYVAKVLSGTRGFVHWNAILTALHFKILL